MADPQHFDARFMRSSLEVQGERDVPALEWVERSQEHPRPFWQELFAFHSGVGGLPAKSTPFGGYALYADLVLRHIRRERVALRWYSPHHGWRGLSYDELHAAASARARSWAGAGVAQGALVALVMPLGPELLVALAACLRLGAVFSWLPPEGSRFVQRRLEALGADFHVSLELYTNLLGGVEVLWWERPGPDGPLDDAPSYPAAEPIAQLFSPLDLEPGVPRPLSARLAYHGAMRDAHLIFALAPGDNLAAPCLHPLQSQPALLFTALIAGACFCVVRKVELAADPSILAALPLRSIGLCAEVRDMLLAVRDKPKVQWEHWFRNPEEPYEYQKWRRLIADYDLAKVPVSNVVLDAASGGSLVCSARRVTDYDRATIKRSGVVVSQRVLPSPGLGWKLCDLNGSGQEVVGNTGILTARGDDPLPAYLVVAREATEGMYAGAIGNRRVGCVYPWPEVVEALEDLPFARGVTMVAAPVGGPEGHVFVLVVFVGPVADHEEQSAAWEEEARRLVRLRLGHRMQPDRVRFYPLYPRAEEGALDQLWVQEQFQTGGLFRRAHRPLFQTLTALREVVRAELGED